MSTFNDPVASLFSAAGNKNNATIATQMEMRLPLVLDDLGAPAGLEPIDFIAGTKKALIWNGKVWRRDDSDTTSTADNITVVVSSDSVRFKANAVLGQGQLVWPVTSFLSTPPGSVSAGDQYGIGASPTGAWASNAKNIATALVGSPSPIWAFTAPQEGMVVFDITRQTYRSYTSATWADGLKQAASAASIPPEALVSVFVVVQSYTATPPGSPGTNTYYLVGASATGAWAGQDQKLAKWDGSTWTFYAPGSGWKAYNLALNQDLVFYSSIWHVIPVSEITNVATKLVGTATVAASGTAVNFSTAPTSATGALLFPQGTALVPAYTLAKATNRLKIQLRLDSPITGLDANSNPTNTAVTIAVYKDAQVTADPGNWINLNVAQPQSSYLEFEIAIGDTSSHQYNIRAYGGVGFVRQELQFIEIDA